MCGICGKVYFDRNRPVEPEILLAMTDQIVHRGPDSDGHYINGPVGLGSRRLSIIDVEGGRMPIPNEDETIWIVYNGEVYNFPEIRRDLIAKGHEFATHSDTETIVHLYEEVGDDCVKYLNGMFGFALWDNRKRRLLVARDHVGIKPIYYAHLNDRLVFGSEIKSMLPDGLDREIDPIALHDYLSLNYVPGPRTMFSAIKKLLPGHILTYEQDTQEVKIQQYWDIPASHREVGSINSTADIENSLLNLLRQSVRDQMISDVPLGAFLSGGVDSSLIVALMSEVSDRPVKTFSIGFQQESYSELPYARIIANKFKTDHHELIVDPKATDIITSMANYFDEPFADSSSMAVYLVSQLAAENVTVALSGDGGDEIFGGYSTYQADKIASYYRRLPRQIGSGLIPRLVNMLPVSDDKVSLDFKLRRFMAGGMRPPLAAHYAWKAFFSEEAKSRLYRSTNGNGHGIRPSVSVMQQYFDDYPTNDIMNKILYVDSKVLLVDGMLTKVDRMSMAHSLEVRVPLLDLRLVEFMAHLPSDLKINRMKLKYLLKKVSSRVLPDEILNRPKAGFSIPVASWVKTDLRDMVNDHLGRDGLSKHGLFDEAVVREILNNHWSGKSNHSHNIWNLLMFSLWHERYANVPVVTAG